MGVDGEGRWSGSEPGQVDHTQTGTAEKPIITELLLQPRESLAQLGGVLLQRRLVFTAKFRNVHHIT